MTKYRYSPLQMSEYMLGGMEHCEVRAMSKLDNEDQSLAAWNLFWLSVPDIDKVVGAGQDWWRVYKPHPDACSTVITDVIEDEPLFRKLLMRPDIFLAWFERERDKTIFDCYAQFGGPLWVETVTRRANIAIAHLASLVPVVDGNVHYVKFGRRRVS